MPKGSNQKLKLYYLAKIMMSRTDDEHGLTMPEIKEALEEYGVSADRKSLYDDFEALRILGIDVYSDKEGKKYLYKVGKKQFEIAELKLLVDAIQSSKFITEKKSAELIGKLTQLVSDHEAAQLKRQVVVHGRIKTMNESIYYIIDDIHYAISRNRKIRFEYLRWNLKKEMERRREEPYEVSPWALIWDDENYYLVGYDEKDEMIKHYRVDKMRSITATEEMRSGREAFERIDLAAYSRMNFAMFSGQEVRVRLRFKNELVGIMLDRFGSEIAIMPEEDGYSSTSVNVALSDQFLGWIFSLGPDVVITGPDEVVKRFADEIRAMGKIYGL